MTFKAAIPSIITLLNLSSGVLAILLLDLFWSPVLVIVAGVFDLLDGAAARLLNAESAFGKELDSICDMVSFGVAPACIYWLLVPAESYLYILVPLLICAAVAVRLAKFNLLPSSKEFLGLASPAAAMFYCGLALAIYWGEPIFTYLFNIPVMYIVLGLLPAIRMITDRRMFSLKGMGDPSDRTYIFALILLTLIVLVYDFRLALPISIILYSLLSEIRLLITNRSA